MTNPERAQDKQDAAEVKNFTRTPNMLIFSYPELSPQEKWLYVCLKHLCGARGTRYLSLRFISEQTGISVGALSTSKDKNGKVNEGMIRHLHDAGLIHSEIKKKEGRGNAQYHITITDVWALNQEFFRERAKTRSDFGQDEEEDSQPVRISDEPVQISDKPDRNSDKLVQISDEPVRILGQLQDYSKTITKTTDKTVKQESVIREQNSTAHPGADAQPARSSQIEPYHPDFNAHQQKPGYSPEDTHGNRFALVGTRRSDLHRPGPADRDLEPRDLAPSQAEPTGEPPAGVAQADRRPARRTPEVAPAGTETHSQLSTLTVEKPRQASAKVEKKQGNSSSQVVTRKEKYAPPAQAKAQLTLLGGQVRTDYETIRACKLRLTQATIKALNELGEMDGMSFANLKDTIELIEDQELVKKRNIPIDVQVLASEDGYWRFDKWYPVVVRNRQKQASKTSAPPPTSASLPSYGHLSDEEYYASLRKGTTHARAAYAR